MVFQFQTHRLVKMECSVVTLHELYQRSDQDQRQDQQQRLVDHSIQQQHKHQIIEKTVQERVSCHLSRSLVSVSKIRLKKTVTELTNLHYEFIFR